MTNKIRHEIDKDNYAWRVFVDFEKAFNTVDHHILLKKNYNVMLEESRKWCQRKLKWMACFLSQ